MTNILHWLLFFIVATVSSHSWSMAAASAYLYQYDAIVEYVFSSDSLGNALEEQSYAYDNDRNLWHCCNERSSNSQDSKARVGPFFALLGDFIVTKGGQKLGDLSIAKGQRGAVGRQKNVFRELDEAEGRPHTVFRRNPNTGRIENYQTFDRSGIAGGNKRFRGSGKPHGGVKPPLALEPRPGHPGGRPHRARPARDDELPLGF